MLLVFHIVVALSSLVMSTLAVLAPTKLKLRWSYALTGSTLASGIYLVLATHSGLARACITGVIYIATVSVLLVLAGKRLALAEN